MEMTSFRCYDFLGRPGPRHLLHRTTIFLSYVTMWSLMLPLEADGNYNLYMDRHEVHRLLGLSSDIYLVREGVVNEYALNFVVNVPSQIEKLHFSWQSLIKKPVHYDLAIEFADFIALLQPSTNISLHGKIPQKLETFRIILPCSGRLSTEVSVIIRFTFYHKSPKHNATVINIRRNKICLTKEFSAASDNRQSSVEVEGGSLPSSRGNGAVGDEITGVGSGIGSGNGGGGIGSSVGNSTLFIFQDPTPSLLLAGLLVGCAVAASLVFLIFFICLRRKLISSTSSDSSCSSTFPDPNSISNNSSPACLLRQSIQSDSKWDNFSNNLLVVEPLQGQQLPIPQQHAHILRSNSPLSRSWSRNSYVTIASFWNDIFNTGVTHQQPNHLLNQHQTNNSHNNSSRTSKMSNSTFNPGNRTSTNSNNTSSSTAKGSDVSPYAYAHILGIQAPPPPPPPTITPSNGSTNQTQQSSPMTHQQVGSLGNPHLLDWYSQSPSTGAPTSCTSIPGGHIYSNHLYSFNPSPKHSFMSSPIPPPPNHNSPRIGELAPLSRPTLAQSTIHQGSVGTVSVGPTEHGVSNDGNTSTAGRSGTESLIQVDGWQCRKNFIKETDVVERFL